MAQIDEDFEDAKGYVLMGKCHCCGRRFSLNDDGALPEHDIIVTLPQHMSATALESGATGEIQLCPGAGQAPRQQQKE